jgi:short-subunit dehydrogenase
MVSPNEGRRLTALVTGASSGIGAEIARVLAEHGHNLVLVARRAERLEALRAELEQRHGISALVIPADLSGSNTAQELYNDVSKRKIEIDILVNNAGFNVYGPFTETDLETERRMIQVNVVAVVELTKRFARDMVRRGFGRILNLGSTGSFAPAPLDSLYAASKAFVLSFSEALAEELKGTGVAVTILCPGPTETEFAARAGMLETKIFSGRLMLAQRVAAIGYRVMMRGQTTVIAGLANQFQIWSMRFALRALVAKVAKGLMRKQGTSLAPNAHRA